MTKEPCTKNPKTAVASSVVPAFPSYSDHSKALYWRDYVLYNIRFGEAERARKGARQIGHIWLPYLKERWLAGLPSVEEARAKYEGKFMQFLIAEMESKK